MKREGIYELKIEPFFNDPSQLFIELDIQYIGDFNDLKQIEPKMDNAYNYLFGEIKDFLSSLK